VTVSKEKEIGIHSRVKRKCQLILINYIKAAQIRDRYCTIMINMTGT